MSESKINDSYNVYKVTKPINVKSGRIAPAFGQPGLGTQHFLPNSVRNLVKDKYLSEV
ncbi:TNT domain-containing protein [Candidatus Francisella endociliophora]|uniref:TNT domain-containing protein n=1 Tax=Candidatus Francisella endociliophora TaxID=653937 RepID=UPI000ACA7CA3|nr:TNT domain-containing protein [Francisella sp. FSC1006]